MRFRELKVGEFFGFNDNFFMKIDEIHIGCGMKQAIRVKDAGFVEFWGDEPVEFAEVNFYHRAAICGDKGVNDKTILINGKPHTLTDKSLSYAEIVELAFPRPLYTVIFTGGPKSQPIGTVIPKQAIAVRDGMKIEVAFTGNA
jgi:hypothetical protein